MGASRSPPDSAFAVVVRKERMLIVRTRRGKWQLPGGHLEQGERHWNAARREVHEETGLRVELLGLTGVYGRKDGSRAVVFAARAERRIRLPGPRHEIREQRWVRQDVALALLKRSARRRLRDALASPRAFAAERAGVAKWRSALCRIG